MSRATRKIPKSKPQLNQDGWENYTNGLGVLGRDKRLGSVFRTQLMTQEGAEEIWRGDDIATRLVEVIPDEMMREGYEIQIPDDREQA